MMNWICNTAVTGKEALRRLQLLLSSTNKTTWWWRWVPEVQLGEIETAQSTSQRNNFKNHAHVFLNYQSSKFLQNKFNTGNPPDPFSPIQGSHVRDYPMCMWSKGYKVIAHGLYILCSSQLFFESLTFSVLF